MCDHFGEDKHERVGSDLGQRRPFAELGRFEWVSYYK
jgi:hypothetical protein